MFVETEPSKLEIKSTMHFNYYLLISHPKNEKIKYLFKNVRDISGLPEKTEIAEPICNQPVKHMVCQNLEVNVLESR